MDSSAVRAEVICQENSTGTLSLDWPTSCVPLFSVLLKGGGHEVTHSRLVPRVTGNSEERQLHLSLPLLDLPANTHYTTQLTSITEQREVDFDYTLSFSKYLF